MSQSNSEWERGQNALYLEDRLDAAEQESKRLADILIAVLKRGPEQHTFTITELTADDGRKLLTSIRGDGTTSVSLHRWHNEPASGGAADSAPSAWSGEPGPEGGTP